MGESAGDAEEMNVPAVIAELPSIPERNPMPEVLAAFLARYPSEHSRRTMASALDRAAGLLGRTAIELPWWQLSHAAFSALRARLIERHAPATVNVTLAAIRGLLKTCWRMNLTSHESYMRAIDVPPWRGERLPTGRMIPSDELARLFKAASGSSPLDRRDAAMLAILLGCGLRAAEVTSLTVADYDAATGEVRVLRGKGAKDRLAYLAPAGQKAVAKWLEVRGPSSGALFCDHRRVGEKLIGSSMPHLSPKGLYYRVRALVRRASLGHTSPHDFRRTFISILLDGGNDISTVQRLAGHSSVTTTQRYDRRPEAVKKAAAYAIAIPYRDEES